MLNSWIPNSQIQKAKLRHKEIKMQETFSLLEKQLRDEVTGREKALEELHLKMQLEQDHIEKKRSELIIKEQEISQRESTVYELELQLRKQVLALKQRSALSNELLIDKFNDVCSEISFYVMSGMVLFFNSFVLQLIITLHHLHEGQNLLQQHL